MVAHRYSVRRPASGPSLGDRQGRLKASGPGTSRQTVLPSRTFEATHPADFLRRKSVIFRLTSPHRGAKPPFHQKNSAPDGLVTLTSIRDSPASARPASSSDDVLIRRLSVSGRRGELRLPFSRQEPGGTPDLPGKPRWGAAGLRVDVSMSASSPDEEGSRSLPSPSTATRSEAPQRATWRSPPACIRPAWFCMEGEVLHGAESRPDDRLSLTATISHSSPLLPNPPCTRHSRRHALTVDGKTYGSAANFAHRVDLRRGGPPLLEDLRAGTSAATSTARWTEVAFNGHRCGWRPNSD